MQAAQNTPSMLPRMWQHLSTCRNRAKRLFPAAQLTEIAQAIHTGEQTHHAEIRLVIESALTAQEVWMGVTPRVRAQQLFAELGIWDTAQNTGILIYVNLADHKVEILVDRGLSVVTQQADWQTICDTLVAGLNPQHPADLQQSVLQAIASTHAIARQYFPVDAAHPKLEMNELPDAPLLM